MLVETSQNRKILSLNFPNVIFFIFLFSYFKPFGCIESQLITALKRSFYKLKRSFYKLKRSFYKLKRSFYKLKRIH